MNLRGKTSRMFLLCAALLAGACGSAADHDLPNAAFRIGRSGYAIPAYTSTDILFVIDNSGTMAEQAPRYAALAPRRLDAIFPTGADEPAGVEADLSAVAEVLRHRLDLYSTTVELSEGVRVTTLRREAVMAQLLGRGGLVLGLAGSLLRLANDPPIDVDEVREVLKAARLGDRFQPLLELLQVA